MFPNDIIFLTTHVAAASDGAHFPTSLISLAVAVVAAVGAWASQRASSKASTVSTRMDAEKEAYERARAFDIQTIERQQQEIKELREQITQMRERLARLEGKTPLSLQNWEGLLSERLKENPGDQEQ